MIDSDLKLLLNIALEATQKASAEILQVYNSSNFEVEAKSDNSPLTLADRKAHNAITEILKQTGLPILSEEGKSIPYQIRKEWDTFWMVDPLDGTKEFIKRNGEFTVNIALIEKQKPVLGVVVVPVSQETYYGGAGLGAFKISNEKKAPLAILKKVDIKTPGIRVVASRSHLNDETQSFIDSLNQPVLVSKGSSLKFMMLAEGLADIYPRYAPTMEWDTAAAHAILNQMNMKVSVKGSNQELSYNKEDLLNPSFLVL